MLHLMDPSTTLVPPDFPDRATCLHVFDTLRSLMALAPAEAPEAEARRNHAAMAHVAALRPADAAEIHLA